MVNSLICGKDWFSSVFTTFAASLCLEDLASGRTCGKRLIYIVVVFSVKITKLPHLQYVFFLSLPDLKPCYETSYKLHRFNFAHH